MQRNAFSLVELSIVLVILGLLTGGILAGQSLIRAAEIRKISTDFATINTSVNAFRDKYFALPGDMANATSFWGVQDGNGTGLDDACYTSLSTGQATCNGNGDGQIHFAITGTGYHERGRAWQHLSNAGLIDGSYNGYQGVTASETRVGGVNARRAATSGTHYNLAFHSAPPTDTEFFTMSASHIIEHTVDFTGGAAPARNILKPEEVWNIDTKLDDGRPALGAVRGPKMSSGWAPNCSNANDETAEYVLSNPARSCYVLMVIR